MRMAGKSIVSLMVILVIAAVVAFFVFKGEKKPSISDTLVYCSEASPEGFNPQLYTTGTTMDVSARQVFNRLVEFDIGTTNIVPGLAESYTISEDGTTYTFYLRKNVAFQATEFFTPTRPFNADDVLFTFNRQRLKEHPYHTVSGGSYQYFNDMGLAEQITNLKKLDDHTVQIELKAPNSPFIANIAMGFMSIHSKEYADQQMKAGNPEQIDLKPIGTGPYKFKSYQKDAIIRYQAHENYWRGKESINNLVFAITKEPSVRLSKLKTGECHVMSYPLPSQHEQILSDPNLTMDEQPGLNIGYWAFNMKKAPFTDLNVRKALVHAIDRQSIIDAVYLGKAQQAKNFIPPTIWSYHEGIVDYEYNPELAKKYLAKAGYPNGFKMTLWAMPVQRPYNPNAQKMAELMKENLKAIGVEAEIITYEWGTYLNKIQKGDHDTTLIGWTGDNGDPDNFFSPLLSCNAAETGSNYSFWCDKNFDKLIVTAQRISDIAERTRLYQEAQEVFKAEAPALTIAHSKRFQPRRKTVKGLKIDPFGGIYFSGVSLEP